MNHYVVLTDRLSNSDAIAITALFRRHECAWWHYYRDSWLLIDYAGYYPSFWRDQLAEMMSSPRIFVIPARQGWAGYAEKLHMEWLTNNWHPNR